MPSDKAQTHYTGNRGQEYHIGKRSIPPGALPWLARLRAQKIQPWVQPADVVLEYGVGFGWNLALLKCQRRLGHDISELLPPLLQPLGIEFVPQTSALDSGSIDVVICHHMLEHALAPASVLQEMHRLLRSQGQLLLFVPYEKERRYRRFNPKEPNHHLYSWNVQTLANLVQDSGFRVSHAEVARFRFDRFAAQWATRWRLGERGFRWIRSLALLVSPGFEVRVQAVKTA